MKLLHIPLSLWLLFSKVASKLLVFLAPFARGAFPMFSALVLDARKRTYGTTTSLLVGKKQKTAQKAQGIGF